MSEAQTTDDARPWGDRGAGNGVEALFLWTKEENAKLHARIDAMMGRSGDTAMADKIDDAHARLDALEAAATAPATSPGTGRQGSWEPPVQSAATLETQPEGQGVQVGNLNPGAAP